MNMAATPSSVTDPGSNRDATGTLPASSGNVRTVTRGRPQKPNVIVQGTKAVVKYAAVKQAISRSREEDTQRRSRPTRRKQRRQQHGSAWHWKQTDCWYYTLPSSKKRIPLFDEDGIRIRGKDNKDQARLALARVKLAGEWKPAGTLPASAEEWLVARVCSEYLQYCQRGVANSQLSREHWENAKSMLNDLCRFCGALPVAQLKKGHIRTWIENHSGWKSPATHRAAITVVLAAFNYSQDNHEIANPLKGLKKPATQPRLQSLTAEEETTLLNATDEPFRNFLFAAIHTGLRPFCELAKLRADDVEEISRGMMWRVYSSKTKKTRKIPVRPEVAVLVRRLMRAAPSRSGKPLFQNPAGNPWKKSTGVTRFLRIKRRLGWVKDPVRGKYSCYTCRHTFAHRMLSGFWNNGVGCSVETLAELIGDTPKVAFDHYGREWGQHFHDPLWNAIGVPRASQERNGADRSQPASAVRRKSRSRSGRK